MVNYIYKAIIWTDTSNVIGADNSAEAANKTDFETNYKASTVLINDIEVMETVFILDKTYAQFKVLVDGVNITWGDVKTETKDNQYILFLLTTEPI